MTTKDKKGTLEPRGNENVLAEKNCVIFVTIYFKDEIFCSAQNKIEIVLEIFFFFFFLNHQNKVLCLKKLIDTTLEAT